MIVQEDIEYHVPADITYTFAETNYFIVMIPEAYVGFDVLQPFVAWSTRYTDDAERAGYLEGYAARLRDLGEVPSLPVHAVEDFGPDWMLKPGVEPRTIAHQPWPSARG
jgi:NAD(P)H dehydrogenase (quinone)